jgi:hypothetical protein
VTLPLLAAILLAGWWAGWWGRRAWVAFVALEAVLVLTSFVAIRLGEADEERVEAVVPEAAIETHEERAEVFAWFGVFTLVVSLAAALVPQDTASRWIAAGASGAALVGAGLALSVGHSGGALVYTHGAGTVSVQASAGGPETGFAPFVGGEDDD